MSQTESEKNARVEVHQQGDELLWVISGDWTLAAKRPEVRALLARSDFGAPAQAVRIRVRDLENWDVGLMIFLAECRREVESKDGRFMIEGLPEGAQKMFDLSKAVPRVGEGPGKAKLPTLDSLGECALQWQAASLQFCDFLGAIVLEGFALLRGGRIRWKDFFLHLQSAGPQALPIVILLSFLTGLIIAFIGLLQLQKFAADIYVADLVGLAMSREMAALMVGIILAGRTGAAYAAQLGSMRVNEEIDALVSFGLSPVRHQVVPRVIALTLMSPLLYAFACLVGILGGTWVSMMISDVSLAQYNLQIQDAVGLNDFFGGLIKSVVFGLIVALSGCYRGLNSGKDATAVGQAATSAVVTSITWIVISDAVFAVIFNIVDF